MTTPPFLALKSEASCSHFSALLFVCSAHQTSSYCLASSHMLEIRLHQPKSFLEWAITCTLQLPSWTIDLRDSWEYDISLRKRVITCFHRTRSMIYHYPKWGCEEGGDTEVMMRRLTQTISTSTTSTVMSLRAEL